MASCAVPGLAKVSLRGDRIALRAVLDGDAERLYAYLRDPQVNRFLNVVAPRDFATFARDLHEVLGGDEASDVAFVIADLRSHAALGALRLSRQGSTDANLSFWLGQEHWGKHFASDAIRTAARYALRELGIATLFAQVFGGNVRSQTLLGRLGFGLARTRQMQENDLGKRQELTFRLDDAGLKLLAEQLTHPPLEEFAAPEPPAPFDTLHGAQDWGSG